MKIDGYLIGPFDNAGFDVGHVLFTKSAEGEKGARPFVFVNASVDWRQVINALNRSITDLLAERDRLMKDGDYSAEFSASDAEQLEHAKILIESLT